MKIHSIEITDPKQVKILNEGLAAMLAFLQMHGVPPDLELSAEDYDALFKKQGIDLSGKAYLKLLNEIDAHMREKRAAEKAADQ